MYLALVITRLAGKLAVTRHHRRGVRGGARECTDSETLYAGEFLGCLSLMH